jgi:hypothetical protein
MHANHHPKQTTGTPTLALVQQTTEFNALTDRMEQGFSQLHAFLAVAVCDDFKTYSADILSSYLLGCCDLLKRLQADHESMLELYQREAQ